MPKTKAWFMPALWLFLIFASQCVHSETATLVFAGDAMMHQRQIDAARKPGNLYDFTSCFEGVRPIIEQADYAVVNLETPLGGAPYSGYPCFCAPDSYLDALAGAGFDFFLCANNHCLDRKDRGITRTISQMNQRQLPYTGLYRNQAERDSINPRIVDVKGIKIAILNYTYGTNGFVEKGPVVIDRIDRDLIKKDVVKARERGADLTACCLHWGVEYELLPRQSQRDLAKYVRSLGVDMVIGGHPHVIQPMEFDDSTHQLTVYSLGNFLSGMRTPDTRGGALVTVTITKLPFLKPWISGAEYSLVFVDPNGFKLQPVTSKAISPAWQAAAKTFSSRARKIYNQNNKNVPERL